MNLLPSDELNDLRSRIQFQLIDRENWTASDVKKFRKWCEDEILDLLLMAYTFGCEDANEMLYTQIAPTYEEMRKSIYKKVAGKDFVERIDEYAESGTVEDIMRVAETDSHRVYNDASVKTAKEAIQSGKVDGSNLFKTWNTMLDDRVRDTHMYLEGVTIPFDADFYTYDGDHAFEPGGFELPENVIGCRCYLTYSM